MCVNVNNIASSNNLDWIIPLEVSEGFTQEISKFCFHIWETIWYFKESKATENPWQRRSCMGFAD